MSERVDDEDVSGPSDLHPPRGVTSYGETVPRWTVEEIHPGTWVRGTDPLWRIISYRTMEDVLTRSVVVQSRGDSASRVTFLVRRHKRQKVGSDLYGGPHPPRIDPRPHQGDRLTSSGHLLPRLTLFVCFLSFVVVDVDVFLGCFWGKYPVVEVPNVRLFGCFYSFLV